MSTPHIAGSAAVLRDLHNDWSPAQIKSSLVNRADLVVKDAKTGIHDIGPTAQGAGRENLSVAANGTTWLSPVSAGFGKVPTGSPTSVTVTVFNPTANAQTFTVSEWKFTPSTGLWTWVSGSDVVDAPGVYGTEGTPASGNMPGARADASTWVDHSGNLLLFGGLGVGQNPDLAPGAYSDLWSYSPSSGQWTWVSGADKGSATTVSPVYGTLGVAALGNTPGSRGSAASWIDASDNLWLFGGELVSGSEITSNSLNDLWEFNRQ